MSCLTVWLNMICVQCLQRSLEVTDAQEQELRMVVHHTGAGNTLRFFAWELISILNDWAPALTATHQLKSGIDDIKQLQSLQVNAWWDSDEGILWFNHLLIEKVEHFWKILTTPVLKSSQVSITLTSLRRCFQRVPYLYLITFTRYVS